MSSARMRKTDWVRHSTHTSRRVRRSAGQRQKKLQQRCKREHFHRGNVRVFAVGGVNKKIKNLDLKRIGAVGNLYFHPININHNINIRSTPTCAYAQLGKPIIPGTIGNYDLIQQWHGYQPINSKFNWKQVMPFATKFETEIQDVMEHVMTCTKETGEEFVQFSLNDADMLAPITSHNTNEIENANEIPFDVTKMLDADGNLLPEFMNTGNDMDNDVDNIYVDDCGEYLVDEDMACMDYDDMMNTMYENVNVPEIVPELQFVPEPQEIVHNERYKNVGTRTRIKQLVKTIHKENKANHGVIGDLRMYLSDQVAKIDDGIVSRVVNGQPQLLDGYYIQCNCCAAYGYFHDNRLPNNLTESQFLDWLDAINCGNATNGILNLDETIYGKAALYIADFKNAINLYCYNCGLYYDLTSQLTYQPTEINTIPSGVRVEGLHDDLLSCLFTERPPPPELKLANNVYNEFMNKQITTQLKRANFMFLNSVYPMDSNYIDLHFSSKTGVGINRAQPTVTEELSNHEIHEILLYANLSGSIGSPINIYPSGPNVAHALYDIMYVTSAAAWFRRTEQTSLYNDYDQTALTVYSADINCDLVHVIESESYLFVPNYESNIMSDANTAVRNNVLYTPVTGSNVPAEWNLNIVEKISMHSSIIVNHELYNIITIKSSQFFQIVSFVRGNENIPRMIRGKTHMYVRLPDIDMDSILHTVGFIGDKWSYKTVNVDLVNRLIVNGMSGGKAVDSLLAYLSGLSATRYVIGSRTVDLTKVQIQDGLNELVVAYMIMNDNSKFNAWLRYNYTANFNIHHASRNIYRTIIGRIVKAMKELKPEWYDRVESVIMTKTEVMYKRDNICTRDKLDLNMEELTICRIIDSKTNLVEDNYCNKNMCVHHQPTCTHTGTDICACCNMPSDGEMCTCCEIKKCVHACEHKCEGQSKHKCDECRDGNHVHMQVRCTCCLALGCHNICSHCYEAPVVKLTTKPIVYNVQPQIQSVLNKNAQQKPQIQQQPVANKNVDNTQFPKLPQKHVQFDVNTGIFNRPAPDVMTTEVEPMFKKIKLPQKDHAWKMIHKTIHDASKLNQPSMLLYVDTNDEVHAPYMCDHGVRHLKREPLTKADVVSWNLTERDCALQIIADSSSYTLTYLTAFYSNNTGSHTQLDLQQIARKLSLNMLICTGIDDLDIVRYGRMHDQYIILTHSSAIIDGVISYHWVKTIMPTIKTWPTGFWSKYDVAGACTLDLSKLDVFGVEETLKQQRMAQVRAHTQKNRYMLGSAPAYGLGVVHQNGKSYISNGRINNLRIGKVHYEVPQEYAIMCEQAFNADNSHILENKSVSIPEATLANINIAYGMYTEYCISAIYEYKKRMKQGNDNDVRMRWQVDAKDHDDFNRVIVPNNIRVKALDMVMVEFENGKREMRYLAKVGLMVVIYNCETRVRSVTFFKASFGSHIRTLLACFDGLKNLKNLATCTVDSNINGVGGSGKSTQIRQHPQKNKCHVVCKFTSVMKSYRGYNFGKVATLESYLLDTDTTHLLAIDEAYAISAFEFVQLIRLPNMHVMMAGDENQIGPRDMTNVMGARIFTRAPCLYPTTNLTHSYRFGDNYAQAVLKYIYPEITGETNKTTEYYVNKIENLDDVAKRVIEHNLDSVFVFMDEHYVQLSNKLRDTSTTVYKVHADQGMEGERVGVVYYPSNNIAGSILNDKTFITTALTRCKSYMLFMTDSTSDNPITDAIYASTRGAGFTFKMIADAIDFETLRLKRDLTAEEQTMLQIALPHVPQVHNFKVYNDCVKLDVNTPVGRYDMYIKKEGISGSNFIATKILRTAIEMNKDSFEQLFKDMLTQLNTKSNLLHVDDQYSCEIMPYEIDYELADDEDIERCVTYETRMHMGETPVDVSDMLNDLITVHHRIVSDMKKLNGGLQSSMCGSEITIEEYIDKHRVMNIDVETQFVANVNLLNDGVTKLQAILLNEDKSSIFSSQRSESSGGQISDDESFHGGELIYGLALRHYQLANAVYEKMVDNPQLARVMPAHVKNVFERNDIHLRDAYMQHLVSVASTSYSISESQITSVVQYDTEMPDDVLEDIYYDAIDSSFIPSERAERTRMIWNQAMLETNTLEEDKFISMNMHMNMTVYARLILLNKAAMIARMSDETFKLCDELNWRIVPFGGCALFSGVKIVDNNTGKVCIISSAHLVDMNDGIIATLNCNNRTFSGHSSFVKLVIDTLFSNGNNIMPVVNRWYAIKAIIERLMYIIKVWWAKHARCEDTNCATYYLQHNMKWLEQYSNYNHEIQPIGFEKLTHVLVHESNGLFRGYTCLLVPNKVRVFTLVDIMRNITGVQGADDAQLNAANLAIIDELAVRKYRAEYTECKTIVVSAVLKDKHAAFISNHMRVENVVGINKDPIDDTVASIVNAYFIQYMYIVTRKYNVDIFGIDAMTVSDQNHENYKLDADIMTDELTARIITQCIRNKIAAIQEKIKLTGDEEKKKSLVDSLNALVDGKVFLRNGKDSNTVLYGLGVPLTGSEEYDDVYFITCEAQGYGVQCINNVMYLLGDNGRQLHDLREHNSAIITRMGPFSLRKLISNKLHIILNRSVAKCNNMRRFKYPGHSRHVDVPIDVYRKLLSRGLAEDVTMETLIAYARTMCNTYTYTHSGVYSSYALNPSNMYEYALVVANILARNRKFIKSVDAFYNSREMCESGLLNMAKSIITGWLTTKLGANFGDTFINFVKDMISERIPDNIKKITELVKDINIYEVQTEDKYIFTAEQRMQYEADIVSEHDESSEVESINSTQNQSDEESNYTSARETTPVNTESAYTTAMLASDSTQMSITVNDDYTTALSTESGSCLSVTDATIVEQVISDLVVWVDEDMMEYERISRQYCPANAMAVIGTHIIEAASYLYNTRHAYEPITIEEVDEIMHKNVHDGIYNDSERSSIHSADYGTGNEEMNESQECLDIYDELDEAAIFKSVLEVVHDEPKLEIQHANTGRINKLFNAFKHFNYKPAFLEPTTFKQNIVNVDETVAQPIKQTQKPQLIEEEPVKERNWAQIVAQHGTSHIPTIVDNLVNAHDGIEPQKYAEHEHEQIGHIPEMDNMSVDLMEDILKNAIPPRTQIPEQKTSIDASLSTESDSGTEDIASLEAHSGMYIIGEKSLALKCDKCGSDKHDTKSCKIKVQPPGFFDYEIDTKANQTPQQPEKNKVYKKHKKTTTGKKTKKTKAEKAADQMLVDTKAVTQKVKNLTPHTVTIRQQQTVEVSDTPHLSACILYSGTRGDSTPLNAIAEIIAHKYKITALKPADVSITYQAVTYNYTHSYDWITEAGINNDQYQINKLIEMMTKIYDFVKNTRFDVVIALHFAHEWRVVKAKRVVQIIPQIHAQWNATTKCGLTNFFARVAANIKVATAQPTYYWAVPSGVIPDGIEVENIGFPIMQDEFVMDDTTYHVIQCMQQNKDLYTVVTLGSMFPREYATIMRDITEKIEGPILYVTGFASKRSIEVRIRGRNVMTNQNYYGADLIVVSSIKYKLIGDFIKEIHSHGGAGTLITSLLWNKPHVIYPMAFDQEENKTWYINTQHKPLDIAEEYTFFHHQVRKLFDCDLNLSPVYKTLDLPQKAVARMRFVGFDSWKNSMIVVRQCIDFTIVSDLAVQTGCVGKALTYQFDKVTEIALLNKITKLYTDYSMVSTMSTLGDCLFFYMMTGLDVTVVQAGRSYNIKQGNAKTYYIMIDDTLRHAKVIKDVVEDSISAEAFGESVNWYDCGDNVEANERAVQMDMVYNCLIQQRKNDASLRNVSHVNLMKAIHQLYDYDWARALRTRQRMMNSLMLQDANRTTGGWTNIRNIGVGDLVAAVSDRDTTLAVCVRNYYTGEHYLFNARSDNGALIGTYTLRKNIIGYDPMYKRRMLLGTSLITAINQVSKSYANGMNIAVKNVCSLNADIVYIYTTYNREHHKEPERACIKSAKQIIVIPNDIDDAFKMRLREEHQPRLVIMGGVPKWCYEVLETNKYRHATTCRFLRNINGMEHVTGTSMYCTQGMASTIRVHLKAIVEWHKTDTETLCSYKFCGSAKYDVHDNDVYTIDEILKKFNIPKNVWAQRKLEKWCEALNVTYETVKLQRVDTWQMPHDSIFEVTNSRLTTFNRNLFIRDDAWCFEIQYTGAGTRLTNIESIQWGATEHVYHSGDDNKFNTESKNKDMKYYEQATNVVKDLEGAIPINSVLPMSSTLNDVRTFSKEVKVIEMYELETGEWQCAQIDLDAMPDMKTMDYWNTDYIHDILIKLPTCKGFKIRSNLSAERIGQSVKLRMEPFPTVSRPSLTKMYMEEANAIAIRQGAYKEYRKQKIKPYEQFKLLVSNYFRDDWKQKAITYANDPISIDIFEIRDWIIEHRYPDKVIESIKQFLDEGWERWPINMVQEHGKTESVVKLNKVARWFDEVTSRAIIGAPYALSAIFAPFFKRIKIRFKEMLNDRVFYADGMTPQQLSAKARSYGDVPVFVEDDLSMQDGQTTHEIIEVENLVYSLLGADQYALQLYMCCHKMWRWKGAGIRGFWDAMRMSGEDTTSLGNSITNLVVHNQFFMRNKHLIKAYGLLGDDCIFLCSEFLDAKMHGTETKELYNIISKLFQKKRVGAFLAMLMHSANGHVEVCPHYKRLRHRYSVCNYAYTTETRDECIDARTLSYAMVMGNIKETKEIATSINAKLEIPDWYDVGSAIIANANYEEETVEIVESYIGSLVKMMRDRNPTPWQPKHWVAGH